MSLVAALAATLASGLGASTPPAGCKPVVSAKPVTVAAPGGAASQQRFDCAEGTLFLTSRGDVPLEAYVSASGDDGEKTLGAGTLELTAAMPKGVELAYVRFDGNSRVAELTLSAGSFSWDVLPAKTYLERLQNFAAKHPNVVALSPEIRLNLPGQGQVHVVASTFTFGGAHVDRPGPTVLHVIAEDGKPIGRIMAQLDGSFGGLTGTLTPLPIAYTEGLLKHSFSDVFQGSRMERSVFYRIDLAGGALHELGLTEAATDTQQSLGCLKNGACREIRYGLMPEAGKKSEPPVHYEFRVVRVEIKRSKEAKVLSTKEKKFGSCKYDEKAQDYKCPKLPADASL